MVAVATNYASDPYFSYDPDVVKSYSFDYDALVLVKQNDHKEKVLTVGAIPFFAPVGVFLCATFPFEQRNIEEFQRAQHLAIKQDGIKYVVEAHNTQCRCESQKQGKTSKTVLYDNMTDCDIEEPAGVSGCCCCSVPNTIFKVHIDTNTTSAEGGHELTIEGLVDPEQFKKDVWALKRGEPVESVSGIISAPNAPLLNYINRDDPGDGSGTTASVVGAEVIAAKLDAQTSVLNAQTSVLCDILAALNTLNTNLSASK